MDEITSTVALPIWAYSNIPIRDQNRTNPIKFSWGLGKKDQNINLGKKWDAHQHRFV